ncbi:MAG: hypothetical protein OK454_11230, partial [Thaumarchaeota archaeon]|nr:hypothetical protein [Nitrososphaerota archaeon]
EIELRSTSRSWLILSARAWTWRRLAYSDRGRNAVYRKKSHSSPSLAYQAGNLLGRHGPSRRTIHPEQDIFQEEEEDEAATMLCASKSYSEDQLPQWSILTRSTTVSGEAPQEPVVSKKTGS